MVYRVLYKRISDAVKQVVIVESEVTADDFGISDGALVFYNSGQAIMTIPSTFWFLVEPAEAPSTPGSSLVVPGGS